MLYVRINVPTIGVPKNPEGLQPLAKLHKEEIVLFENGSIAEIRKTTADSIDASPYHFVYTRPEDIQTPHLSDVIPIDIVDREKK